MVPKQFGGVLKFKGLRSLTLVGFALAAPLAFAGSIPVTYSSSATLDETSGTDYFGWSGKTISISSTVSSMTPVSVTTLTGGGVQDVYNAIINITGFESNQAGTMTLTWNPASNGMNSVSVAMTYENFGLTTTVTETLNSLYMPNATPLALVNAALTSPLDQVTISSNWGENVTFGVNGSLNSANDVANVATAPEPAGFALLAAGLIILGVCVRRLKPRRA